MRNSGIEFDSQHVIVTLFQDIVDSKSHKSQLKKYYISYICNITNGAIIVTYGSCIMTTKIGFSKHSCFIKIVMVPLAFLSSFSFSVKKATGNTSFGLVLSVFYSAVFSNLLSNRTSARNQKFTILVLNITMTSYRKLGTSLFDSALPSELHPSQK